MLHTVIYSCTVHDNGTFSVPVVLAVSLLLCHAVSTLLGQICRPCRGERASEPSCGRRGNHSTAHQQGCPLAIDCAPFARVTVRAIVGMLWLLPFKRASHHGDVSRFQDGRLLDRMGGGQPGHQPVHERHLTSMAIAAPGRGRLSAVTGDGILSVPESRIRGMPGGNPMTIQRTVYASPVEALAALIRA
jgi:hypothetical protein